MTIIKELRDENARLTGIIKRNDAEMAEMKSTISEMAGTIAEMKRRLDYENPHSPPSQNSIPTRKRKAEAQKSSGAPAPHKKAPGRKKGHAGVSHSRRPGRAEHHRPGRCTRCGSTDMQYGRPVAKTVTDLVSVPELETVQHLSYPAVCCGCGHRENAGEPGVCGTEIGPNLASYITGLHAMPGSLGSVRRVLAEAFGLGVGRATVLKCLMAVSGELAPDCEAIGRDVSGSDSVHLDETVIIIDGKQGCIWIVVGKKDGMVHAVRVLVSGGGAVTGLHFPYGHVSATVDGKTTYAPGFPILQRCWAHILREARAEAGNSLELHKLYVRLKELYYRAKMPEPDPGNRGLYDALADEAQQIANEYASAGCRFGVTLDRAVPNLFTFLLHPGMEPTNNWSGPL